MTHPVKSPRKLIEVALPLDAINAACSREKSIRHGHPSTLHLWWARRPLAAARAVIFAQLVNDPGYQQGGGFKYGVNKKEAAIERKRLFKIIEDLVLWENTSNEELLERARTEIRRSWREVCELNKDHPQAAELFNPEKLPALHDPFAGGGSIPLEAQRLGLEAYASDLNPVAVLINKAMIEIPPKFAGRAPVGPLSPDERGARLDLPQAWPGATGLAEDVRRYGAWMRDEAQKRIGHLYPPIEVTKEIARERPDLIPLVGRKLTVIAWLWARTVKSPNPAFSHVDVPLASTFILSSKDGNEVYVQPVVEGDRYQFTVKMGTPPPEAKNGTKLARGANFCCLLSNTPIEGDYIKAEGRAGRMGVKMMSIVAEGARRRVYLAPTAEMESIAHAAHPTWKPETSLPDDHRNFWTFSYGLTTFGDLFTPRQLAALTTFSDLVAEAREKIRRDALAAGMPDDGQGLDSCGTGATAYAEAASVYLAFALNKLADRGSSICTWFTERDSTRNTFARQSIPMTWDFAELNTLLYGTGSFEGAVTWTAESLEGASRSGEVHGSAVQADAQTQRISSQKIISTDPPYYDNIGYADLSDFFYIWLRRILRPVFPGLLATMSVPKTEELVATPYRHGSKYKAEAFFLSGMTQAMRSLAEQAHPEPPITIYYAFKQAETKAESGTSSTGWETFLEAVHRSGLQLSGTWPMRTELSNRMIGAGNNALASCIILVCRKRPANAPTISRREFLRELNVVLPDALDEMTKGSGGDRSPVAPVDLSQAIIGPGMAVFSRYAAVLEADGSPMIVRTALQLINNFLAEDDFDPDTQFCLHWFEQHGWGEGVFGDADTLSRAKGTSVGGVRDTGVVESGGGIVRLRKWSEYPSNWDPHTDARNPVWETLHHLIRALKQEGETGAGQVLATLNGKAESARQLAYRLYTLCERQGWAEDARAYNELITSWSGIESEANSVSSKPAQSNLFELNAV
jgi:putative DNA methylase